MRMVYTRALHDETNTTNIWIELFKYVCDFLRSNNEFLQGVVRHFENITPKMLLRNDAAESRCVWIY